MTARDLERLGQHLDWNLLRTFMVIVQEQGVTRAASRLGLTQPAVSQALKRLEEQLGRRLIERGHGRFRVTEAGAVIYAEVLEIYGNISRFGVLVREIREEISGHIRILLASRIQSPLFDTLLERFHAAHPLVTFRLDVMASADIHTAIQQKTASLGIGLMREPPPLVAHTLFARQRFRLYCGPRHPLFGRADLHLADLKAERFVSFTSDQIGGVLSPLTAFRAQEGMESRTVGASVNLDEVRRMIVAGLGIGPLPEHVTERDVRDGLLWPLPPAEGVAPVDLHLLWNPAAKLNRAERAFLETCARALDAIPLERRFDAAAVAAWAAGQTEAA
ncbi:LysR family transcriptional regulator [Azospirillum sp. TSO22-1]|uniref:LysR family transcriptional regulator n=1 Tax=Azospirillum sp. TSO22-1 TaxID=716789 RepID=UPI000D615DF0|nr:LysR family transcriptional regulator [Azospirillum sp. TSO22-1]PWC35599.1 LysR family transcriptional regulator [Azospirillum sp. TSO22-1]